MHAFLGNIVYICNMCVCTHTHNPDKRTRTHTVHSQHTQKHKNEIKTKNHSSRKHALSLALSPFLPLSNPLPSPARHAPTGTTHIRSRLGRQGHADS